MTPFQGAGAGQAIEDAYVLANVLSWALTSSKGKRKDGLERALVVYDSVRRPIANDIARKSRLAGRLFSYAEGRMSPEELGRKVKSNWEWSWMTSASSSVREARRLWEH